MGQNLANFFCRQILSFKKKFNLIKILANDIIEPGEVIIRNKATASMIIFESSLEFCYNCLSFTMSPVPCTRCSGVVFCSQNCLNSAMNR